MSSPARISPKLASRDLSENTQQQHSRQRYLVSMVTHLRRNAKRVRLDATLMAYLTDRQLEEGRLGGSWAAIAEASDAPGPPPAAPLRLSDVTDCPLAS